MKNINNRKKSFVIRNPLAKHKHREEILRIPDFCLFKMEMKATRFVTFLDDGRSI